jgi:hypothetical protein
MTKKSLTLLLATAFATVSLAFAQATTVPVDPNAPMVDPMMQQGTAVTIADITGDNAPFLGTYVTFSGNVDEVINARMFILGEAATLGSNQVLVINNSGYELPLYVTAGRAVQVTGIVYSAFDQGGFDMLPFNTTGMNSMGMTGTTGMAGTTDPSMMPTLDPALPTVDPALVPTNDPGVVNQVGTDTMGQMGGMNMMPQYDVRGVASQIVQERFANFTIIELTSVTTVMEVPVQ